MANKQYVVPVISTSGGGGGAGTVTNTGALTANQLLIGNGGVDEKALGTLGTSTTVLHGNAGGAPTFAAVNLATDVTGALTWTNLPTAGVAPGTGIAFKSAAATQGTVATNPLQLTLAIAQGDTVVIFTDDANATGLTVKTQCGDDAGNPYSCVLTSSGGSGGSAAYVALNVPRASSFVKVWGHTGIAAIAGAVYSGVKSAATYTTATGSAATPSISLTTTVANSFMVAGFSWFKSGTAISISANVGNLRASVASSASAVVTGMALVDNTQASLASLTCSGTLSQAPTGIGDLAIELIPA